MTKNKQNKIGRYQILDQIATGGMGEIFLAYDSVCCRTVALKKIRSDLASKPVMRKRFLKEAKIASQLTHPAVIPIYSIHEDKNSVYYTMPYVESKTLKEILVEAIERVGTEGSIPNLIRIFLAVCEAIAFVHSKQIIHRDLKPSNILVGKYGEVLILDWGIANYLKDNIPNIKNSTSAQIKVQEIGKAKKNKPTNPIEHTKTSYFQNSDLTHPGKVAGTITYLAPECVLGEKASILSDVYALGVILYHILTLRSPFKRKSVESFRKQARLEKIPNPALAAPYRDIPLVLAKMVKKCLAFEKKNRYQTVLELIADIKNYIEGRPEWLLQDILDLKDPNAFIFQENLYLPQTIKSSDWASVWLSKTTLSGSFKISFEFLFKKNSSGMGILFSIPENKGKYLIDEGFLIYFNPKKKGSVELSHKSVLVLKNQNIEIKKEVWHQVEIEKSENTIRCYLNGKLILSYISYIPIFGSYLGLFSKDNSFLISNFKLFAASNNLQISCLALPDAFLAKKDVSSAYLEYKRIASSFPGRAEEREALFRAGITILEKAKQEADSELFEQALLEFEKLKKSAGAPLEYLGKSIVYATLKEDEEESKCLELALRKFKKHPLLYILKKHLLMRLHESSFAQKEAHLRLMLIFLLLFPEKNKLPDTEFLTQNLEKNLPQVPFFLTTKNNLLIKLAVYLNKKNLLLEYLQTLNTKNKTNLLDIHNILLALLEMSAFQEIQAYFLKNKSNYKQDSNTNYFSSCFDHNFYQIKKTLNILKDSFKKTSSIQFLPISDLKTKETGEINLSCQLFLLNNALENNRPDLINAILKTIELKKLKSLSGQNEKELKKKKNLKNLLISYQIWAHLLKKQLKQAEILFKNFTEEERADDRNSLFIPYGIFLMLQGELEVAKMHFNSALDTSYPSIGALFGQFILKPQKDWPKKLLPYEKQKLKKFLKIYYTLTQSHSDALNYYLQ